MTVFSDKTNSHCRHDCAWCAVVAVVKGGLTGDDKETGLEVGVSLSIILIVMVVAVCIIIFVWYKR